jgi:uncharacterized protein YcbK (DUF882 family)
MPDISRRRFCIAAAHALTGLLVSPSLIYCAQRPKEFPLSFFHTHTEECLEILHTPGQCCGAVQRKINTFLRDFRTGEVRPIDTGLLDIISQIQSNTGSHGIIEIISGYRSPQTNNFLHNRSNGVATHSLHLEGRAVDIRITDLPTRQLYESAIALRAGGVGYYAASDFVHLDTGRFRTW